MKTIILSIWSMAMFSLYFALGEYGWVVTSNIVCVYASTGFVVGWRIYKLTDNAQNDNSERTSTLAWTATWVLVVLIFILRDLNFVSDIGIISAIYMFFVLLTTVMTSCYVIIKDSGNWTGQLFSVCALHWVLSHASKDWLGQTPLLLVIPLLCIVVIRIAYHIETNRHLHKALIEIFIWVFLASVELAYALGLCQSQLFHICVWIGCNGILYIYLKCIPCLMLTFSIALTPFFGIFTLLQIKKEGLREGLGTSWLRFTAFYKHDNAFGGIETIPDDML
jgi:hypothetical protein